MTKMQVNPLILISVWLVFFVGILMHHAEKTQMNFSQINQFKAQNTRQQPARLVMDKHQKRLPPFVLHQEKAKDSRMIDSDIFASPKSIRTAKSIAS